MDTRPVIIGSGPNSRFGRKAKQSMEEVRQPTKTYKPKQRPHSKQIHKSKASSEIVDVYIGDDFVRTTGLLRLVRFSKVAAQEFPRRSQAADDGNIEKLDATKQREGVDHKGGRIDENVAAEHMNNLHLITDDSVERPADKKRGSDPASNTPARKVLILGLSNVSQYPSTRAFVDCLNWMDLNSSMKHHERLADFATPVSADVPLTTLIDLQAAALTFDMRPFPSALRDEIMHRLTTERPLEAEVQYIWEHIPSSDSVVKRMITAYFEHWQNNNYTDEEAKAIFDYVESVEPLNQRFWQVQQSRKRFRRTLAKKTRHAGTSAKPHGGREGVAGDVEDEENGAGAGDSRNLRDERERSRQQYHGNVKAGAETKKVETKPKANQAPTFTEQAKVRPKAERWQEAERRAAEMATKRS